jgi:hypothetical protein
VLMGPRRDWADGQTAKRNGPGHRPEPFVIVRERCRSAKLGIDAGELGVEGAANAVDDGDDGNGNAGGDEAILDGGRARLVLHKPRNEGLHG